MGAMTDEALALRVLLASFAGTTLPAEWAGLLDAGLGGICLFGSNTADGPEATAALTGTIRAVRSDAVIATDEEGGDVTRMHAGTGSPVLGAAALGAAGDLDLTRATGAAVAADLAAAGINLDLAPVADVNSNAQNPVIGTRSFSADPDVAAAHVAAWLGGLQAAGVAACVKHFPGHGDTGEDSHLMLPVLDAPIEVLRTRELVPFTAAVAAGVAAMMTSHIVVPALDPDVPATLSAPVLSWLRTELGFEGVIVSDALDMAGASAGRGIPAAAVLALAAGADLLCIGPDKDAALIREVRDAIVAAVARGSLARERLVEAAARVDRLADQWAADGRTAACVLVPPPGQRAGADTALDVSGPLPALAGAVVVTVDTPANIAVGEVPWGLRPDVVVLPGEELPDGAALIVQVRDAATRPGLLEPVERAAASRPVVLLEWGWPGEYDGGMPRICTHGSSRPVVEAVRALLATAGWVPDE